MKKISFPEGSKVRVYRENEMAYYGYSDDEFFIAGPRPCEIDSIYLDEEGALTMRLVGGYTCYLYEGHNYVGPQYDGHGSLVECKDCIRVELEEYCKAFFEREDKEDWFNGFWREGFYFCAHMDALYCKIPEGVEFAGGNILRKPREDADV